MFFETACLITVSAPLASAILVGFFGKKVGKNFTNFLAIGGVVISTILSFYLVYELVFNDRPGLNKNLYTWIASGEFQFQIGFLIDRLTVVMMTVVTFVSCMVHVYTIGYMKDDPGYHRFFSYISLFTFSMLILVMSNNFLQLFFGWEAVGLVSYLLIGFWFKKPSATHANLKAFLVNRVGDFGFLLGICGIFLVFGTLDYHSIFSNIDELSKAKLPGISLLEVDPVTIICILMFIGAMGKSAQIPLHVWLPDSMEGPTPISALIHAATMVTAGIFMVARMSPVYELSSIALLFIVVIGSLTAFFMGILGLVQNDIKRVVAYSTLSQLGYMTVALGVSAYSAAIFHLVTHAFFKALLFLAAGSVIIATHHQQNMDKMGGLKKYMPITYWTSLIGTLALIGFPGFSGFFSKEMIIEAVHFSDSMYSNLIYYFLLAGVFITSLYSFRMFFLVFHGESRMSEADLSHIHESPAVVTLPLILLAIPSMFLGGLIVNEFLFNNFFQESIYNDLERDPLIELSAVFHGPLAMISHSIFTSAFWCAVAGVFVAWYCYLRNPSIPSSMAQRLAIFHYVLKNNYGFDKFNSMVFAGGSVRLGKLLWSKFDILIIDKSLVNGSAKIVNVFSFFIRKVQTGYLYDYAIAMIFGLIVFLIAFVYL